ncbi:MAG: lipid-A-disaccharide synthase [Candidatus Omnitrophota bacterium]
MANKKILIVSGEPSGDLYASNLIKDLKSLDPTLQFYGIGGELSKRAGADIIFDITKLALIGVVEVLRHIFVVKRAYDTIISKVGRDRPDVAILVDYPGFNLKLAADLAKRNIPVVYYISPQVWAWGRKRVHAIKKYVKKMLVFFKFEEELYREYGVDAEFVGHPLVDMVKVTASKEEVYKRYSLSGGDRTIAILPGSRELEIKMLLPIIAEAAELMSGKTGNVQFIISKHPHLDISLYEACLKGRSFNYKLVEGDVHNIVGAADFAIVASGTATLETGMLGTPLMVVYKTAFITSIFYYCVVKLRFLGLINIVAGKEVAPELLQYKVTPENITAKAIEMLSDPAKLANARKELAKVKASLGSGGASMRAARAVIQLLG